MKFVRQVAPEGSPAAFTGSELEAFHQRPDVQMRFEPYGPASPTTRPP